MPQQAPPGQGDQCIYCQLIENPQQLNLVGETEHFYAWLEVQPRAKGHTQIVPKEHIESVMDLSPEQYHEAMTLVREVMEKAVEGLGADGVSVTMNVEESAGQMMPHVYISVFPRFEEDERAGTPTGAIFQHVEELQQNEDKLTEIKDDMQSVSVDFGVETIEPHPESQRHTDSAGDGGSDDGNSEEGDDKDSSRRSRSGSIEWV